MTTIFVSVEFGRTPLAAWPAADVSHRASSSYFFSESIEEMPVEGFSGELVEKILSIGGCDGIVVLAD